MPRSDHRGDPLLSGHPIDSINCKWADPPPLRKLQCRFDGLIICVLAGRLAVALFHAGQAQLFGKPSLPVTARREGTRLGERVSGVVDVTQFGKALGDRFWIGICLSIPSPLPELPRQICTQLCARRRVLADIAQSQFPKARIIERARRPLGLEVCAHA